MILFFAACAKSNPPTWKAQGPGFAENKGVVEVYYDQDRIERAFGYHGVITFEEGDLERCKKLAAKHGADGIVIENNKAYAFKYTDKLTKEEKELILHFIAPTYYRD